MHHFIFSIAFNTFPSLFVGVFHLRMCSHHHDLFSYRLMSLNADNLCIIQNSAVERVLFIHGRHFSFAFLAEKLNSQYCPCYVTLTIQIHRFVIVCSLFSKNHITVENMFLQTMGFYFYLFLKLTLSA